MINKKKDRKFTSFFEETRKIVASSKNQQKSYWVLNSNWYFWCTQKVKLLNSTNDNSKKKSNEMDSGNE